MEGSCDERVFCVAVSRDNLLAHISSAGLSATGQPSLATSQGSDYSVHMLAESQALSSDELRNRLRPFCEKHGIRRLEIFGSAADGLATSSSDVDLLVTLDESNPLSTSELLEMAGEAEELIGRPVDFVLRSSLEKSPNRFAREHILATTVCFYGN